MSNNSIAALGGGLVGGAVGFAIGGPGGAALGFSIGSAAGSALVPLQLPDQVGPRLEDLEVTSSAYGQPIPLLWGSNRVSGKLIFSSGKKETRHEEDLGGKGGPEQTAVSFTYSLDACYSLGVLPPSATSLEVRRVWINSQLVYDNSETANAISLISSTKMAAAVTVYDGSESQLPSSLQESYKGAGNVPAYRGMGLIEFDDLQLAKFGNGAINVSCEVVVSGSAGSAPALVNTWSGQYGSDGAAALYDNGTIITGAHTTPDASDKFYHVIRRYSMTGTKLSESRTLINHGNFSSATGKPDLEFGVNDPFLLEAYWDIAPIHQRFSNPTLPSITGQTTNKNHPFNSTWNEEPWGDSVLAHSWLRLGDYYYVAGGDDGPVRTTPAHLSRWPIITDISSAYYGYPVEDADIAVNIGTTYGADNQQITVDYSSNRIYMWATTGGNYTISSWDTELNFIARWDETVLSSPPPLGGVAFWSGSIMLRRDVTGANKTLYQYSFDPDTSNSEFTQTGTVQSTTTDTYKHIQPLTETLALTASDVVSVYPLVSQAGVTLATIFADVLSLTGASASDYDVTALTDTVKGYQAGDLVSGRRSLEPLMRAYFIDAAEIDNKIVFVKRGGASVKTIPDSDLMSVNQSTIRISRGSELELPKRVTFSYINQAADYQTNIQHADRLVAVGSVGISSVSIPAVIDDDVAAQIADSMLYSTWIERERLESSASTKYLELTPTDVVTLGDSGLRVRLTEVDNKLISEIKLKGVIDFSESYVSTRSGGTATASSTISGVPGPTITNLLDIPILRDIDAGIIKYLSMSGPLDDWGGAILYKSTDSGVNYFERATSVINATYGYATDTLSDGDTSTWDFTNTVNIGLASGSLSSESELSVLNGANAAAFGAHGRWEIIQFQTATLEGDGTYTLSDLLRGRRGTEHNTGNHVIGDSFVLLTESSLTRLNDAAADIGSTYLYKGVSIGNTLQEATQFPFTSTGVSITPFSPTYINGTRDGSNNLTVTFKRRDYMGYTAQYSLPMSEDTQSYELEFWNTAGTIQYGGTKTSTSQTYSYTAASQTTDSATPGQSFLVKIYQMSATVGRGYEGSEII